jgi:hypothetical protein
MASDDMTVGMLADYNMAAYLELFAWFRANPQLGRITARTRLAEIPAVPCVIAAKFGIRTPSRAEVLKWSSEHGTPDPREEARRLGLTSAAGDESEGAA